VNFRGCCPFCDFLIFIKNYTNQKLRNSKKIFKNYYKDKEELEDVAQIQEDIQIVFYELRKISEGFKLCIA